MKFIVLVILIVILFLLTRKEYFQSEGPESGALGPEDPIASLCRSSLDFYRANEELCKEKVGSECSVPSYLIQNPDACRILKYEPCTVLEYLKNNQDECKKLNYSYTVPVCNKCNSVVDFSAK